MLASFQWLPPSLRRLFSLSCHEKLFARSTTDFFAEDTLVGETHPFFFLLSEAFLPMCLREYSPQAMRGTPLRLSAPSGTCISSIRCD